MKKNLIYSLIIFLVFSSLFSLWYLLTFGKYGNVDFNLTKTIFFKYGIVMALPPSFGFFIARLLFLKIKNQLILALILILISILVFFSLAYIYVWYITLSTLTDNPVK
ncbi:hypothetical protein [Flavobacterium columnare]|uniref:DUF1705 domain-containing protein n=2 Tax=Flavobacterium TaxID=237 RepID=A0ABW8PSP6_9FLAO|nr:hypothetical protein [Flavobacterium columnare]SPE76558.1 hypothetical protein FLACOL_00540 [Flavobacterium columnare]